MSDQTIDGGQVTASAVEKPTQTTLQPAPTTNVEAQMTELVSTVKTLVGEVNALKSDKDKKSNRHEREIENLRDKVTRIAELIQDGKDPSEVKVILEQEEDLDFVRKLRAGEVQLGDVGKQTQSAETVTVDPTILGIDPNDAEYVQLLRDGKTGIEDLYKLVVRKKSQAAPPNPSTVISTVQGGTPPQATPEQYKQEMLVARGKGYEVGRQIKEKYRNLGVDVDTVPLA